MYINLVLGAVALAVVWFYLKKLFSKEDELSHSPAKLLENELQRRREKERETVRAFERLKDAGTKRVASVAKALDEMRAAMPEEAQKRLEWRQDDDRLVISMTGRNTDTHSLEVFWKIPDLDLAIAAKRAENMHGEYVLRPAANGREEREATLDACMKHTTSFIVDLME